MSAIPDTPSAADLTDADQLLAFVRGRHAPCPRCGYDLCDLTEPKCPECGEPLVLKVGSPRVHFGWLLFAAAPGCFSGVAATLLAFPLWRFAGAGPKGPPIALYVAEVFGILSASFAIVLYRHRHRFLALPAVRQRLAAFAIWGAHVLAFVALLVAMR